MPPKHLRSASPSALHVESYLLIDSTRLWISFVCKIVTLNSANAALAEIAVAAPTKNENSFIFISLSFASLSGLHKRKLISKTYL